MFGAVGSKEPISDVQDTDELKYDEDDTNQPSEDSDEESKFIAAENASANRKKKKSGGFQSMGMSSYIQMTIHSKVRFC
jgi:ATP-dependent RNA helicase DDX54/DBP10